MTASIPAGLLRQWCHMRAEVMSIGDELTSGQRLNTNSQWLSLRLAQQGIHTDFHTTVADDLAILTAAFCVAIARSDLVLVTGGLGPTADDLTRQALADAVGVPLRLDEPSLRHIEALFAKRGREMPTRNRVQALFPEGSRPVANPHGSAPSISKSQKRVERLPMSLRCPVCRRKCKRCGMTPSPPTSPR